MIHHNRVAVDIDGVLANYVKGIAEFSGKMVTDLCARYNMIEPGFFQSREDFMEHHSAFIHSGGLKRLSLLDETAPQALQTLHDSGFEVFIVTARKGVPGYNDHCVEQDTRQWLNDHGLYFDKLILAEDKTTVDAEYIIDDSPFNITQAIESGKDIRPFVRSHLYNTFGCSDLQPYDGLFDYAYSMADFVHKILEDQHGKDILFSDDDPLFGSILSPEEDENESHNWLDKLKLSTSFQKVPV